MLATEVRDPDIGLVTVTRAKVTGDLSLARIYWTLIGDAAERKKTAKALARAAPYVRHLLSQRLTLRRSPEVQFLFDQSVAAQDRVEQIIQEIHAEEAAREQAAAAAPLDPPSGEAVPDASPAAVDEPTHGDAE